MPLKPVRVRFAPSPTGPLHIGGLRTAIYNYLYAKKHGGEFILRIEDTDRNRYVEGAEDYIIKALKWMNIPFDEGPGKETNNTSYRQSERSTIYKTYIKQLLDNGKAYIAFDSSESLDTHRKEHEQKGKTFIYNWHNRNKLDNSLNLSKEEVSKRLEKNMPHVVRFLSPDSRKLVLHDVIRGKMEIDSSLLDDKILFKSDGMPTYHFANVVDDHLMKISHVIRGEEWLPSLALHVLLYEAFAWDPPIFAHLPLILKPEGKGKLSKRDGAKGGFPVFPFTWEDSIGYKEEGYFPDALLNYLSLLGWNPGTDQEIFNKEQLISLFELERVHKAGARFDPEKTKWYNHEYLQQRTPAELTQDFLPILQSQLKETRAFNPSVTSSPQYVETTLKLLKERATFVKDFWPLGEFFYHTPDSYNEKAVRKRWKPNTNLLLKDLNSEFDRVEDFSSNYLEELTKNWLTKKEYSFGEVMPPLRLAIVGDLKGPHLFDIMSVIGKEETIRRINIAIDKL